MQPLKMPAHSQILEHAVSSPLFHPLLLALVTLALTIFVVKRFFATSASHKKLPPSPSKVPVIGHLHKLGIYPHRSLQKLSRKYGPLMLLRLGRIPTLVVSSADAAEEVMKTHDLAFADRPRSKLNEKLLYNYKDVASAPYGEYWRQMKSICVIQLLSNKRVYDTRKVRENETALLVKKIAESSPSVVDLSDLLMAYTNDVVSMSAFGRRFSKGEGGRQFRRMMKEFASLLGGFDVGTYIPQLAWLSSVMGLYNKVDAVAKEFDEILERIVDEHISTSKREKVEGAEDFVDVLLQIYNDKSITGFSIDRESIKAIVLDVLAAGTDTTFTVLEWTMAELLRHPQVMKKVQKELRLIFKNKSDIIAQDDYEKMPYLKAVIKETLRVYPPVPLLVPRKARNNVNVMGYDIVAGTTVIINVYAIGRDPSLWDEPDEFRPERFLNSTIDFRGHDFQLIPFGAGRRSCPGISFAMVTNELVLANLLHKFYWELPNGTKGKDLDMTETTGLAIHKKGPLLAVAIPYSI
ncbi:cytochrome P450 736A117-like [Apium graveolens]|uniref:cytochrome P450 736A117-like n=1 Tax=Apium graveolens TaxID=4045 RepID=UPI003D79E44D